MMKFVLSVLLTMAPLVGSGAETNIKKPAPVEVKKPKPALVDPLTRADKARIKKMLKSLNPKP